MNFKEGRQTLYKVIDKYKYDMGHMARDIGMGNSFIWGG